jgi:hypothetical protein
MLLQRVVDFPRFDVLVSKPRGDCLVKFHSKRSRKGKNRRFYRVAGFREWRTAGWVEAETWC